MQPSATHVQPAGGKGRSPIKAELASIGSPCGLGSIGGDNGWGMPLPAGYLVNGSVDQGVDYTAPGGTPECAMGDGTIVAEGGQTLDGFGPWAPALHIDDGPLAGATVYYGHAGPDLVPIGAHVANGQPITEVGYGIVGLSTGPHLEIGFYPPGQFGAGQAMLNYINTAGPSDNSSCTVWNGFQVCGAIRDHYLALGGAFVVGLPLTNETSTPDGVGRFNHFSNNWSIYWTPTTGARSLHGAILSRWASMGWERSVLGYPVTDETGTPDGIGRFNHFSSTRSSTNVDGSIYWTPTTGAKDIYGAVRARWASWGWERSILGYPVTDESPTPDTIGRFIHFSSTRSSTNVDGSIYWTPTTGADAIYGTVRARWASWGWERSILGYPVTDESPPPDKVGRFIHFSSTRSSTNVDGSIYWTPSTGAHEVHGAIRALWASMGWERSCHGYPTSDTTPILTGNVVTGDQSTFQTGSITLATPTRQVSSLGC
jgi:uncharacterized protein with LGFP repeats